MSGEPTYLARCVNFPRGRRQATLSKVIPVFFMLVVALSSSSSSSSKHKAWAGDGRKVFACKGEKEDGKNWAKVFFLTPLCSLSLQFGAC